MTNRAKARGRKTIFTIFIVLILIAILLYLFLYNGPIGFNQCSSTSCTSCIFPAQFGCLNAILHSSTGQVSLTIQQEIGEPIKVTAYGCNNYGSLYNMESPNNSSSGYLIVPSGSSFSFNVTCFINYTRISIAPSQLFKGYIIINYTLNGTEHTSYGQLVAKAI